MFTFVEEGTLYADQGWVLTTNAPIVLGTTPLVFSPFSGAGAYIAGAGLTSTGNTFDVIGTANRITVNADSVDIASTYAGQTSIVTLGTITTGAWNATVIPDNKIASALTGKTYNGLTITSTTGTFTIAAAKTLTVNNTITLSAPSDGLTLNIGPGGTLGTAAFTNATAYISSTLMTTLGDIIYGGASGAATRLGGNTAATALYLKSTGNGSIAAAPV